jgi:arginine decarboxylase
MKERSFKKKYIYLTKGTGEGKTKLSAFDKALCNAGISNLNLILLSSVIPANSEIIFAKPRIKVEDYGQKLYLVLAKKVETRKNKLAVAGLGWVQAKDGRGLFVEHEGESEREVKNLIENSLKDLMKNRPEYNYGKINCLFSSIKCEKNPVCAIVAAVYQIEKFK